MCMSAVKVAMPLQQEVVQFPQEISPGAGPPLQHIAVFHSASRLFVYHFSQKLLFFCAHTQWAVCLHKYTMHVYTVHVRVCISDV